jgi:hypothetical protein
MSFLRFSILEASSRSKHLLSAKSNSGDRLSSPSVGC